MPNNFVFEKEKLWSRRRLLQIGLAGGGLTGAGLLWHSFNVQGKSTVKVPPLEIKAPAKEVANPMKMIREFDYGTLKRENGRTIREFRLTADTSVIQLQ